MTCAAVRKLVWGVMTPTSFFMISVTDIGLTVFRIGFPKTFSDLNKLGFDFDIDRYNRALVRP
jgi:hypothetical protein